MREIKFRAYCLYREEKRLAPQMLYQCGIKDTGLPVFSNILKQADRVYLMQYTNLNDKNGKEIYEGDVVAWHDPLVNYGSKDFQSVVEWLPDPGGWLPFIRAMRDGDNYARPCEVIGNIYEDKELLEV